MQIIGIIFFACLAFAIAILILITCCFYKVNSSKEFTKDPEMCKTNTDTIHRMNRIAHNRTVTEEKPRPNANVILFLNKKNKYSDSKRNYQNQNNSDGMGIGVFNEGFSSWGHHSNDHSFVDSHDCGHDGGLDGDCGGGGDD